MEISQSFVYFVLFTSLSLVYPNSKYLNNAGCTHFKNPN